MDTAGSALQASGRHAPPLCAPPLLGGPELPFAVRVSAQTQATVVGGSRRLGAGAGAGRPRRRRRHTVARGVLTTAFPALDINVS